MEINVGGNRCGVEPGAPAVALAQKIAREKSLRFAGLHAYHGRAQHLRTIEERREAIAFAAESARRTRDMLGKAGLSCDIITGAGTGTFELEAASGVYTELQAGSYCFMDADYARNRKADGGRFDTFEHALFVYATVMSTPIPERAVVDAGLKAFAFDSGVPEVVGLAGAVYERPSDEHGNLNVAACNVRPKLGDKILLIPGHCDPTVNLHDWYVGVRGMGTERGRGWSACGRWRRGGQCFRCCLLMDAGNVGTHAAIRQADPRCRRYRRHVHRPADPRWPHGPQPVAQAADDAG